MTSHYADEIGELKESQNAHFNPSDYEEKISVEPDIGDQRQSVFKALPSRPTTPKRVMHRFRFSAVFAFVSAIVAFSLKLVLLLAGQEPGTLEGDYIFAINASRLGQDIIRFERATATSAAPSAISSTTRPSNPLDPLNPLSTSNPLNPSNPNNPFNQLTDSIIGNITDTINSGTQNAINQVVAALVNRAGVQPQYLLFVENICEGNTTVEKCSSYDDKQAGLNVLTRDIPSSIIIGQTNVSVPLIAKLSHSFSSLSSGISTIRKAIFAFLVMSLVVTGLSAITSLLGVFFPHSRVIIYFNILYPLLASVSHLLTAIILTVLIVGRGRL
ncbi:hypothetical protein B0J11DRAFT_579971 [Dendryphion nanum]|uniref:Actin cortical patch SUR7/pH-response regulator PalI n=1 Tax=Dendryphion nanum TaxID=256645 RepID=A0A9P9DTG6_9PLEO|nr:hypothetical protein B0J11DRAFT_579971 [Dendryphion nanum]